MPEPALFYILTPEGVIPAETFVLADQQPKTILKDCLLVVHQASGRVLTIHRTRLIPINDPAIKFLMHKHSVCIKCGKVEGIVLDEVSRPNDSGHKCGLLETKA